MNDVLVLVQCEVGAMSETFGGAAGATRTLGRVLERMYLGLTAAGV